MADLPAATIKKIQMLAQIAADLRLGKDFNITRLTMLKSLCSNPDAAAQFALYLAKKTQKTMKAKGLSRYAKPEARQTYQRLAGKGVRGLTGFLKKRTKPTESSLHELLSEIRSVQDQYEHQRWGAVRIIESMELLVVESALECVLYPWASSDLGYRLARQYAERYNSRYGTGMIPESAPFVDDIAEFWGKHLLGRGWRKRLATL